VGRTQGQRGGRARGGRLFPSCFLSSLVSLEKKVEVNIARPCPSARVARESLLKLFYTICIHVYLYAYAASCAKQLSGKVSDNTAPMCMPRLNNEAVDKICAVVRTEGSWEVRVFCNLAKLRVQ
jgi:hypothetical protein